MTRKYSLHNWTAGPLDDPNAAWRNHRATGRQYRRLDFFQVPHNRDLTKGQAADLIEGIEPTMEQISDYEDWMACGEPNIAQWHQKANPRKGGCLGPILALIAISILAAIIVPLFSPKTNPPPEAKTTPQRSDDTPPPQVTPAEIASPKQVADNQPEPTPPIEKPLPREAILTVRQSITIPYGTLVAPAEARIELLSEDASTFLAKYQNVEFRVPKSEVRPPKK